MCAIFVPIWELDNSNNNYNNINDNTNILYYNIILNGST